MGKNAGILHDDAALVAGKPMKNKVHRHKLEPMHGELVALQEWVKSSGAKVCIVFEGRDTAGKADRPGCRRVGEDNPPPPHRTDTRHHHRDHCSCPERARALR